MAQNYINTRVIESVYGDCYLVQDQSPKSYNWETITTYPISQKCIAEIDACNKAKKYSEKAGRLVVAYNCSGYGMKSFLNGEEYRHQ